MNYKHIDLVRVQVYREKFCIDSSNFESELNKLDQNTLAELYMLNTFYTYIPLKIVDWVEIKVYKLICL